MVASHAPPAPPPRTGDLARNPGMRPDWESNRQPSSLQAGAQSTEPHQPGPKETLKKLFAKYLKQYKEIFAGICDNTAGKKFLFEFQTKGQ